MAISCFRWHYLGSGLLYKNWTYRFDSNVGKYILVRIKLSDLYQRCYSGHLYLYWNDSVTHYLVSCDSHNIRCEQCTLCNTQLYFLHSSLLLCNFHKPRFTCTVCSSPVNSVFTYSVGCCATFSREAIFFRHIVADDWLIKFCSDISSSHFLVQYHTLKLNTLQSAYIGWAPLVI